MTNQAVANPVKALSVLELQAKAKELRRLIVQTVAWGGSGHPGGSLSAIDMMAALYFHIMRHDPKNPKWADRDHFILSKAHDCPAIYACLANAGYFPEEELKTFRKLNSRIQGHASIKTPGVEMSGGSLGQGLSFGVGTALALRLDKKDSKVYVMIGDGECDEGQIWEAAMSAKHYNLRNLVVLLDRNHIQNDRFTHEVMNLEPLSDKWRGFGFHVVEINGNDMHQVVEALESVKHANGPTVIIGQTTKGKGVSFMENNPEWHGKAPNADQLAAALKELA